MTNLYLVTDFGINSAMHRSETSYKKGRGVKKGHVESKSVLELKESDFLAKNYFFG